MAGGLVATLMTLIVFTAWPDTAAADGIMYVPAGAFWMGAEDGPPDESPRHRVYLSEFWIEREKVTNAEFAEFLDAQGPRATGGERRFDWDDDDARVHRRGERWRADPGFERHPAVAVSWYGARDYCAWRGRRLPTEAEWEKAARGDYGVQDLLGNVGEWTGTMLKPYPYRHDDGREPFTGTGRVVVRGASDDDRVGTLSVTRRRSYDRRGAAAGHHFVGFRCATSDDLGEVAPGGH